MLTRGAWYQRHALDRESREDALILLQHRLGLTRTQLYLQDHLPLSEQELQDLEGYWQQRVEGVPLAYVTGKAGFWGLELEVSPATLIPRPDTETLVSAALQVALPDDAQVLDLGTGSGAIALALASERPHWQIWATDQSAEALSVARRNAQRHQATIRFFQGDWWQAVEGLKFNLIVSNPPYIAEEDEHLPALMHEPRTALVAADQGMADLRYLINSAGAHMQEGGWLMLEHGWQQGATVRDALIQAGWAEVRTLCDLGSRERMSLGAKHGR